MRREMLAALALVVLTNPAAAEVEDAWLEQEGAFYYVLGGTMTSGRAASGPAYDGSDQFEFIGCAYAKLSPELDLGRIRVLGLIDFTTPIIVDMTQFDPDSPAERIDFDVPFSGPLGRDALHYPDFTSDVAGFGRATMRIGGDYYDDPYGPIGEYNYTAAFWHTDRGLRNETGAVHTRDGTAYDAGSTAGTTVEGDHEFHLHIESLPGLSPTPVTQVITMPNSGAEGVAGRFLPDPEHEAAFDFPNLRYQGQGTLRVTMTAQAPEGQNELVVRLRSPGGVVLFEDVLDASLASDGTLTTDFALDRFGNYQVEVMGPVALSSYTIEVTQTPERPMHLNFWFEDVVFGLDAQRELGACSRAVSEADGSLAAAEVGRRDPPALLMVLVVLGVIGSIAIFLTGVKLVGHAVSTAAFRQAYKKDRD